MIKVDRVADEWFDAYRSTSDNNLNQHFEWVNDGSGVATIYIDSKIPEMVWDVSDKPKYGWLLESRTIIPQMFDWVEKNMSSLIDVSEGIFTCDENLAETKGYLYTVSNAAPWVTDRAMHPKSKIVSMISSNKSWAEGHKARLVMVEKFKEHADLYGRGFNPVDKKEDALRDYMFSVAIENAKYDTYFTEKLTDCFATGTVPVYYGAEGVSRYFNPDGIIFIDDDFDINTLNEDLYNEMLPAIQENFLIASAFTTAEDYIAKKYLQ